MRSSRFPGFYKLPVGERRKLAAEALGMTEEDLLRALEAGGLDCATADKTVENVLGTFALPFAVGLNVRMNGADYLVPMVVEEPSVVAAASNAAKMIRAGGGFDAETDAPIMIGQVQFDEVADPAAATTAIEGARAELMALADASIPGLVARGGGCRDLTCHDLGDGMMVVHLHIDCRDAMGANLVNTAAEAVAERIGELSQGRMGLRILSNLADERCVRIRANVSIMALADDAATGVEVRDAIVRASRFAEKDPYRAATHNKGIMNGVDAVVVATGNDWRAVEAGAHAFACKNGRYSPLCTWHVGDDGSLVGQLEMPLALGIVGGPARSHGGARLALEMTGAQTAGDLAMLVGCVGMASNLAALKALATDGIQQGHMALHARSVAIAAGARGEAVERIAAAIFDAGRVTVEAAREALERMSMGLRAPADAE